MKLASGLGIHLFGRKGWMIMNALLNSVAGTPKFIVLDANGKMKFVDDPSDLNPGDVLVETGSRLISADMNDLIGVDQNDESLSQVEIDDEIAALLNLLEEGVDPTQAGDDFATAAGGQQGSALTDSATVTRTGASSLASTAFDTTGIGDSALSTTQDVDLANPLAAGDVLSVSDAVDVTGSQVDEGELAYFTVTLDGANETDTLYTWSLTDGSAQLGPDYTDNLLFTNGVTLVDGQLNVPAGVSQFMVIVPTVEDDIHEPTETFTLTVGGETGEATIYDDDDIYVESITLNGDSVTEGEDAVFTVTLSSITYGIETFNWSIGAEGDSATLGVDYEGDFADLIFSDGVTIDGNILTIPEGVSSFTVTVPTFIDEDREGQEEFTLSVGEASALGIINDFNHPPEAEDELDYLEIGNENVYLLRANDLVVKYLDSDHFETIGRAADDSGRVDTLAMTEDGTLYGTDKVGNTTQLVTVNKTNAEVSHYANLVFYNAAGVPISGMILALWSGDGDILYAAVKQGDNYDVYQMNVSDVSNGTVSSSWYADIPEPDSGTFTDFAYSRGEVYGLTGDGLYSVNFETGETELIASFEQFPGDYKSLAITVDGSVLISTSTQSFTLVYDPDSQQITNVYDNSTQSVFFDSAGNPREMEGDLSDNVSDIDDPNLQFTWMTGTNGEGTVGDIIQGEYGYLIFAEDGSYRYVLNNFGSMENVESDVFQYTVSDGVNETTANLEIKIVPGQVIEGSEDGDELGGTNLGDVVLGNDGDDYLYGHEGGDHLVGGLGDDILTGGEGADVFIWNSEDIVDGSTDTITDFTMTQGEEGDPDYVEGDRMDFTDLLGDMTEEDIGAYLGSLELTESDDGTALELVLSHGDQEMTVVFEGYNSADAVDLLEYIVEQNSVITDP